MENLNKIQISAILPVFNEEKTIDGVVIGLKKELGNLEIEYEIITVNDCSQDDSKNILSNLEGIQVINHEKNKGYGASLKTGIKNAKYDWILIIDSDGTYPTEVIPNLVKKIDHNDLIIGSREKKDNAIELKRKHAKKFLNRFASYLAGRKIPDLNSGLRIFKKDIALKYWELFPNKFSFTSTLTMVCLTHGYDTVFVPIDYYKRTGKSSIRAKDFFRFLKLVTKLSLFFKPLKVFTPLSLMILFLAFLIVLFYFIGVTANFLDTTFIVLCATALQTFFFGLLAEIVIHNK